VKQAAIQVVPGAVACFSSSILFKLPYIHCRFDEALAALVHFWLTETRGSMVPKFDCKAAIELYYPCEVWRAVEPGSSHTRVWFEDLHERF